MMAGLLLYTRLNAHRHTHTAVRVCLARFLFSCFSRLFHGLFTCCYCMFNFVVLRVPVLVPATVTAVLFFVEHVDLRLKLISPLTLGASSADRSGVF